jgi:hypothetical protein
VIDRECCNVCNFIMSILDSLVVWAIGITIYALIVLAALLWYEVSIARAIRKIKKEKEVNK